MKPLVKKEMESLLENKIMENKSVQILEHERLPYAEGLALQRRLQIQREKEEIPDTILLLEHDSVYTVGKDMASEQAFIKKKLPAPLEHVDRGGKITYHGPGQLVAYFVWKITLPEVGNFVDALENLTISLLRTYGIAAYSRKSEKDAYGKNIRGAWAWADGMHKKIAAQGIATKKIAGEENTLVTMHGFALNVSTDLSYFSYIHPCGFTYEVMASMESLLQKKIDMQELKLLLTNKLQKGLYASADCSKDNSPERTPLT
ncbi:lipoyl(octanoyl) transferase LipB [Candidatus Woesearchaeota archaeon]|nr:lipoyl(octanoyl) transferase LipB [Candidatus Woesearchaeota archaeon]